jgi:hypothetical protein
MVPVLVALLAMAMPGRAGEQEDEAAAVLVALHEQNAALAERVEALTREVEVLQRELAAARLQLDLAPEGGGQVTRAAVDGNTGSDPTRLRVIEVNDAMGVAVVSGGRMAGLRVGMRFAVMREDRMIGMIRLVDVRERIAGGLMETMETDRRPRAGDRVILSSKQDE